MRIVNRYYKLRVHIKGFQTKKNANNFEQHLCYERNRIANTLITVHVLLVMISSDKQLLGLETSVRVPTSDQNVTRSFSR